MAAWSWAGRLVVTWLGGASGPPPAVSDHQGLLLRRPALLRADNAGPRGTGYSCRHPARNPIPGPYLCRGSTQPSSPLPPVFSQVLLREEMLLWEALQQHCCLVWARAGVPSAGSLPHRAKGGPSGRGLSLVW